MISEFFPAFFIIEFNLKNIVGNRSIKSIIEFPNGRGINVILSLFITTPTSLSLFTLTGTV